MRWILKLLPIVLCQNKKNYGKLSGNLCTENKYQRNIISRTLSFIDLKGNTNYKDKEKSHIQYIFLSLC